MSDLSSSLSTVLKESNIKMESDICYEESDICYEETDIDYEEIDIDYEEFIGFLTTTPQTSKGRCFFKYFFLFNSV